MTSAALAFVNLTFDDENYRQGLVDLVNSLTDYHVEIEEPFTFRLSRESQLAAGVVKIRLPGESEKLVFRKVNLGLTPAALFKGELRLELSSRVDDPASLKWLLPEGLYPLQTVDFVGELTTGRNGLWVRDFKAWGTNPQGMEVKVVGSGLIDDFSQLQPFSRLDLLINVVSPKSRSFKDFLPEGLPELGPVRGSLRLISVSDSELGVEDIALDFGEPENFSLKAEGRIARIPLAPGTINSGIELILVSRAAQSEDLNTLLKFSLPELGAIAISSRIQGSSQDFQVNDLKLNFARTLIEADLKVSLAGKVPGVSGKVVTPVLYLDDFLPQLLVAQASQAELATGNSDLSEESLAKNLKRESFFSHDPFPVLGTFHEIDCDIDVSIDKVVGFQELLRDFKLGVEIKDAILSIDPVTFLFDGGYVKASLLMDDVEGVPEIALKCAVDDLDLVKALGTFDLSSPATGTLTVNVDLQSRGVSPHEMVSNLKGRFEAALEKGRVPSHMLNLVATDMLGWSFRRTLMKQNYADISCGILGLKADKGVLECRTFILEAPSLRITGAGTVDLANELYDLTLYPRKKKKFWATVTPVTIKGPLQKPKVRAIPVKTVALLYGGSLLAPQFFLPAIGLNYLWEMVSKDKDGIQSPCFEHLQSQQ